MKKRILVIIAMLVTLNLASFAQPDFGGGMPPMGGGFSMNIGEDEETEGTPKERAKMETDRLNERLVLDAKQYKKVFNMFKSEFNAEENSKYMGGGRPMGGGMPPMGGGMPPMGGGNFGGGPMGGGFDPSSIAQSAVERMKESEAKKIKARSKKLSKILTPEQFQIWEQINEEDQIRREERMRQKAEEMHSQMEEFRKMMNDR